MTRTHIVHAVSNLLSIGLLTVFMLMFLALFFGCQAPASRSAAVDTPSSPLQLHAPHASADAQMTVTGVAR